jgi:hypothetical protein
MTAEKKLTELEARALHDKVEAAYVKHSRAGMDAITADDLIFIHGNGARDDKAAILKQFDGPANANARVTAIKFGPDAKFSLNDGVAMMVGTVTLTSSGANNQTITIRESVTEVWAPRAGAWKLILLQATPDTADPETKRSVAALSASQ